MSLPTEPELQRLARSVLAATAADQAEVAISSGTSALTRFANNYIHQNVEETETSVTVRAVIGKKIGVAATDVITDEGLRAVAERAVTLARLQEPNEDFVSLPSPLAVPRVDAFNPRTAGFSAEQRAAVVRDLCGAAVASRLIAAGAFRTAQTASAVANSLGVWAYHRDASADINTVVMGETSSGYAARLTLDAGEIDGAAIAQDAIDRCRRGEQPQSVEPGAYDVILLPYAAADLLDYFSYLSFGAQAYLEQRSFMSGQLGQRVMGDNISIWDDGLSTALIPAPFDAEGVPRRRVDFVEAGIARDVVWDSYYGNQAGHPSTGHALPPGYGYMPVPSHLCLAPGDASLDDMVAQTKRGILVTRFWYTRPVHPLTVVMTGMTRDGTFLIEDGKIAGPVHNLRFTQSYLEAMKQVEAIGRESQLVEMEMGCCRVPALRIRGWNFSGTTEF